MPGGGASWGIVGSSAPLSPQGLFSTRHQYAGYVGPLMTLSLSDGRTADVIRDAAGTYRLASDNTTVASWRGALTHKTLWDLSL